MVLLTTCEVHFVIRRHCYNRMKSAKCNSRSHQRVCRSRLRKSPIWALMACRLPLPPNLMMRANVSQGKFYAADKAWQNNKSETNESINNSQNKRIYKSLLVTQTNTAPAKIQESTASGGCQTSTHTECAKRKWINWNNLPAKRRRETIF